MLKLPKRKFRIVLLHKKHIIRAFAVLIIAIMVVIGTKPSIEAVFKQSNRGKEEVNSDTGFEMGGEQDEAREE